MAQLCRFPVLGASKDEGNTMGIEWVICFVLASTEQRIDGTVFSMDALRQMAVDALGKMFPIEGKGVVMITQTSLDEEEGILYAVTERLDKDEGICYNG